MRVIVTGGTGFIGKPLASALAARGDDVVVVSRSPGAGRVAWGAIGPEVERADAVVHLAGEPIAAGRWTASRLERIRASRVETTARLARAIEHASHKPRVLVSGSAVGFYGTLMSDAPLAEDSPPGSDELARIVVAWETAARPACSHATRVVHPRMGVVLGPGGGALEQLARPYKWFLGGPVGSGKQWVSWVHLRDAVRALLFAIDRDTLAGPVNVVAPEAAPMDVLGEALGRALHRPAGLRVPALALRIALGEGLARVLLTGQRAVPSKLVAAGFRFEFPGIDAALATALA